MSHTSRKLIVSYCCIGFGLAVIILFSTCARADLTYSMAISSPNSSSGLLAQARTKVFLKGHRKRVEVRAVVHGQKLSLTTITCPDLGDVMTIDEVNKIYKVQPMHTILQILAFPDFPLLMRGDDEQLQADDNGITISADGGETDIVDGQNAYHMNLNLHDVATGGASAFNAISIDYWVASVVTGYSIRSSAMVSRPDGSTISYDTSGDRELLQELTEKMPVRMVFHSAGSSDTVLDLLSYTTADLPASLFNQPGDCRLVSAVAFAETERRMPSLWTELSLND